MSSRVLRVFVWLSLALLYSCSGELDSTSTQEQPQETGGMEESLADSLTFHASFDNGPDADFARGEDRLFTAASYDESEQAEAGLENVDVVLSDEGLYGGALHFPQRNQKAIFYEGQGNLNYSQDDWDGTVSFWLSLDPEEDLEPGYCDPIQITDVSHNDAAVWVDFSQENPRIFRLGVFGDREVWDPDQLPGAENPDFENRLVPVENPPFGRDQWTHVVITFTDLNSESGGNASLYLNSELQGTTEKIQEPFTWEISRSTIRLGLNYVGLFDELAIFDRALSGEEIQELNRMEGGVQSLHRQSD